MTDRINRRLLLAVLRAPLITSSTSFRRKTATAWVRKITSPSLRPRNGGPGISFGAENDALIAPYLEKLKGKGEKGAKLKAQGSEGIETTSTDNFEISDFVDRSADRPEDLDIPDEALEYSVPSNASERIARKAQTPPARKTKAAAGKKALGVTASQRAPASSRRQSSMIRKIAGGEEVGAAPSDLPESRSYSARTKPEPWGIQKNALKEKFGDQGWQPRKKLSPDAMEGIRGLHEQDPFKYSTPVLAEQFKVSPEAIRRILKSKWSRNTTPEKAVERRERWAKRHDRIWDQQAELGLRPQRMKEKETEDPDQFEKDMARNEILGGI